MFMLHGYVKESVVGRSLGGWLPFGLDDKYDDEVNV